MLLSWQGALCAPKEWCVGRTYGYFIWRIQDMNKQQALDLLSQRRDEIAKKFAVKHLALFGSTARGEAREDSDVDVLVEFEGPATFDGYMGLKFYLEDLFRTKVDLVTKDTVKPRMRPIIEKDMIHVA